MAAFPPHSRPDPGQPASRRLAAEALARRLPPLLVQAELVAQTVASGLHGRRRVGPGEAFWQFRPYSPGDAVAQIDWRETAKTDRAYIREKEWAAAQSVWLWGDSGAGMRWRSAPGLPTKADRAGLLLLALAALLLRGGERVALLGAAAPPSHGRVVLERLALRLAGLSDAAPEATAILPVHQALPRHAGLVLFSDFLEPVENLEQQLGRYAGAGRRVHLLQILDPAEETLPFAGRVRFEAPAETGTLLVNRVEAVRAAYLARLARHRADLAALARRYGWSFAVHHTDKPPHQALLALYALMSGAVDLQHQPDRFAGFAGDEPGGGFD